MANTPWCGSQAAKLYLQSGQFTSTLKTSQDVGVSIDTLPYGISWDGTNTPWGGSQAAKLYLQSGQFTSTLKTSQAIIVDSAIADISWDNTNTPWISVKLYLQSGQFTSTLKTSQIISGVDAEPQGISFDSVNTPWIGYGDDKLYLTSGQFTSTIKTSEYIGGIELFPMGISWDGTNTPWIGFIDDKLYLQSGQFTSTLKTSESIVGVDNAPRGIDTDDVGARLGLPTEFIESKSSSLEFTQTVTYALEAVRSEASTLELNGVLSRAAMDFARSVSSTLELTAIVNIPIHLRSVSNDLIFGQSVSYSKETIQILASTLALDSVAIRVLETTKSVSSSVIFTQISVNTHKKAISSNIEFSGVVTKELERTLPQNLVFTQTVSYIIGIEPTLCELRQHWPRWIFASTSKYFKDIADTNGLHFFIEGTHRFTPENQEYLEFRMDGPSVREVSKNYFLIDVEINILWSFNQDNESFHRTTEITGILMEAMTDICIYRYGDDEYDNGKLLGTLSILQDKKTPIRVNNFGQIRTDVKMMQGTVEGTFRMTLTCTGR